MTQEGSGSPSWTYTYDAENRISAIAGSASETFKYDGNGERVYKSYGAIFWRLPGGPFLSKATLSGTINSEHIYFGGRHVAIVNGTTPSYLFPDHLGGEHVVTNASGTICNDVDTLPFGGEIDYTASCGPSYIFAGMDRGNENSSDLDYAINRYYDLRVGRFMRPDLMGGLRVDPQTLNKYAYVANNPINFTDPTGLYMCADDAKGAKVHCTSDKDVAFETQRNEALQSKDADVVRGASAYGDPGKDNGVTVQFGDPGKGNSGLTTHDLEADSTAANGLRAKETVTIRDTLTGTDLKDAISHEGSHVADAQAFVPTIKPDTADFAKNLTKYQTELKAYMVTQSVLSSANETHAYACGLMGDCHLGAGVTDVKGNIDRLLDYQYHVTPQNQGSRLYPGFVPPPPTATVPH